MPWLQISVEVTGDLADVAAEVFADAGALSATYLDAADEPILEPGLGEHPVWPATRVVALFTDDCDSNDITRSLREALRGAMGEPVIESLQDRDWSSTWRETFHAMRFGRRLWVVPTGEEAPAVDAVTVHLDPGLAFGTGTHITTALCLEWLDTHPPLGREVIDYGCGSGILAVAAGKLGARHVRAVDIDPQALLATRENARRNGMEQNVASMLPDALDARPAGLVIANILANPLIELADTLASHVSRDGQVVLSGILAEQAADVMTVYQHWFDFRDPIEREGWVLLEGVRNVRGKK